VVIFAVYYIVMHHKRVCGPAAYSISNI